MVAPPAEYYAFAERGDRAFDKIVFGTHEVREGLEANVERFDAFLQANKIPEDAQAKCWAGTMASILGVASKYWRYLFRK